MKRSLIVNMIVITSFVFFINQRGFSQEGDNETDSNVNLACLESATLSGSVPEGEGRGIPSDIVFNPETGKYLSNESGFNEYGIAYDTTIGGITQENPLYWQVEWPNAKNINYITALSGQGAFGNQPQPTTGWAFQVWVDSLDKFVAIPKAHNGWEGDTLEGAGGWINTGPFEWRGLEPVVTKKVRFCVFAHPDSVADANQSFADSLWSFSFVGMDVDGVQSTLIQYRDFSGVEADNEVNKDVNLALLPSAVSDAVFNVGPEKTKPTSDIRGTPYDLLFDPRKGDFYDTNTPWAEIGYPFQFDAGFVNIKNPFYWMVEWPVPKKVNYFTWGGPYGNQPQETTPYKIQYWDEASNSWENPGGKISCWIDSLNEWQDVDSQIGIKSNAVYKWTSDKPIQTKKFRYVVWSLGLGPLVSYTIRGRGGSCLNWDETDSEVPKCMLLQYRNLNNNFTYSPEYPEVGEEVIFNASELGEISDCVWDFGDGNKGNGIIVNYTYTETGEYTVTLNATDSNGETIYRIQKVTIINPEPEKIIYETDMCADVDDVGGLAILHAMANHGEANILAVCFNEVHPSGAAAIDAINTWYGRGDIPVGIYKGNLDDPDGSSYLESVAEFPHDLNNKSAPSAVDVYREVLSERPDSSVTIVSVGFLNNLDKLLNEEPELIASKVKELVIMGGLHNDGFNLVRHNLVSASQNVIENWPTPLVISQPGRDILTGDNLKYASGNNPVREAYYKFFGNSYKDRPSWDPIAVLYGVRGLSTYFKRITTGTGSLPNGYEWQMVPGFRSYLQKKLSNPSYERIIEDLMVERPVNLHNNQINHPKDYKLLQNYPNPFNPSTTIQYYLPKKQKVEIKVYNILGQLTETLVNKTISAGYHEVDFIGKNLPSGVYLYTIKTNNFQDVKKMILMK